MTDVVHCTTEAAAQIGDIRRGSISRGKRVTWMWVVEDKNHIVIAAFASDKKAKKYAEAHGLYAYDATDITFEYKP